MNPFELVLGFEMKKPMDLAILRIKGTCCKGSKEDKVMAKKHENKKARAIKL